MTSSIASVVVDDVSISEKFEREREKVKMEALSLLLLSSGRGFLGVTHGKSTPPMADPTTVFQLTFISGSGFSSSSCSILNSNSSH